MDVKKADKLSSLPDNLIHKILSFIDIKDTIKTSVLSSRWRFIWTSMPYLNFSTKYHAKLRGYGPGGYGPKFHEFASNFLSRRNNQIDVSSLEFHFSDIHCTPDYFQTIMDHACLHNVKQMTITQMNVTYCNDHNFPVCFFSSQSLKHLTLIKFAIDHYKSPLTWDLPALTTLHLYKATLSMCDSVLVMFPNLKNLTINKCIVHEHESNGFNIINSRLLNLTLEDVKWNVGFVLVDTPQLKNLVFVDTKYSGSISDLSGELTISAPDLVYLLVKGSYCPKLSLDGFNSLEKADIRISSPLKTDVPRIYYLLQHLHCVKFLALSL
ncbi:F-box domain containing protein [Tanacetum coccineum]